MCYPGNDPEGCMSVSINFSGMSHVSTIPLMLPEVHIILRSTEEAVQGGITARAPHYKLSA